MRYEKSMKRLAVRFYREVLRGVMMFFLTFLSVSSLHAQAPKSWTSSDMYLALRKLNVLGSVLYVAAHPDDENTRLITWLSKEKLYRTGYLSITRGDGGQNLIGDEQGIDLGLIRTQELLAARRIDGGEQFFTRAYDFGYSKTPEETFTKWPREKILADVVWVIRKFQPDVIITRFPTTGEGGHGHHTASAILANEAFAAAADPARFPEQLKFVSVWQSRRVLWNTFNFGGNNTTRDDQFKVDVGGYNPLLGKSYGEIAAESRSQHKSQGFGVPASRGESFEYFKATQGDAPRTDLMEGADLSWNRIPGGGGIISLVDSLARTFDFLHPEYSVEGLVKLYQRIKELPESVWRNQKLLEVTQLVAQCSGLFFDATTAEQLAVQTDSARINFVINNRLGTDARLLKVWTAAADSSFNRVLEKNKNLAFTKAFRVPATQPLTQPYWLAQKMEPGYFNVADQELIGLPDVEPAWNAVFTVRIFGEIFHFLRPVRYKFTDPVKGELYQPVVVTPPVILTPQQDLQVVVNLREKIRGDLQLRGLRNGFGGTLSASDETKGAAVEGVQFVPDRIAITQKNQVVESGYSLPAVTASGNLLLELRGTEQRLNQDKHEIRYDHIPWINYFHPATVHLQPVDLKTVHKKIGYITGAGDKVPEALEQMGYEVVLLGDKELARNNLGQFDAILTGVRAYNTHEWLNKYYDKLMKYVREGGNLIVQYNTSNQIGPVRARIAPVDFQIIRTRITDENAPVKFLNPEHPVFNFPNRITPDDFTGWVQERSIYHASDTSGKFEKLLEMNDPGEKPEAGSLLVMKHGKGWFTYTGLVFFRQLPAGVPGAYRLLANIIALNRKKGF